MTKNDNNNHDNNNNNNEIRTAKKISANERIIQNDYKKLTPRQEIRKQTLELLNKHGEEKKGNRPRKSKHNGAQVQNKKN